MNSPLLIVIPCYRCAELIAPLVDSLLDCAADLLATHANVLFINDSPDDPDLPVALTRAAARLKPHVATEIWMNARNLGFVDACNLAFAHALSIGSDVLLLNSDARPTAGAIAEIAAVAGLDTEIGLVSPRSDNATICNSPRADRFRLLTPADAHLAHRAIAATLPRYAEAPTVVGFCLYVKAQLLRDVGLFDPVFGAGYNEENDLAQRAHAHGFRSVLANHAFVHHIGTRSFAVAGFDSGELERRNQPVLIARHPDYSRRMTDYHESPDSRAEWLIGGLAAAPSMKWRLLLDFRDLTSSAQDIEPAVAFARLCAEHMGRDCDILFACPWDSLLHRRLAGVPGLIDCFGQEKALAPFAAVLRPEHTPNIPSGNLAPITIIFDTPRSEPDAARALLDDLSQALARPEEYVTLTQLSARLTVSPPPDSTDAVASPWADPGGRRNHRRIRRWLKTNWILLRRRARLSLAERIPRAALGRLFQVDAIIPATDFPDDAVASRILDWASLLRPLGQLYLKVARRPDLFGAQSPFIPSGLAYWLENAGLRVDRLDADLDSITARAVKVRQWETDMPTVEDDVLFLRQAYLVAFGRPMDHGGERHYLSLLAAGTSRDALFRNLLCSSERIAMLSKRGHA